MKDGRFTLSPAKGRFSAASCAAPPRSGPRPAARMCGSSPASRISTARREWARLYRQPPDGGHRHVTLALAGSGANVDAITRDLKGSADLSVLNGALRGINIEGALRNLSKKPLSIFRELRGGRTPFDRFIAKLSINEGDAAFDQANVESGSVTVKLNGLAPFRTATSICTASRASSARRRHPPRRCRFSCAEAGTSVRDAR